MRPIGHFNQFGVYSHSVPVFLHAAFYDVFNPELFCDLAQVSALVLVILRRRARNHLEIADLGKSGEDFLLYPVGEICVLRIGTEILKRQHGEAVWRSRNMLAPEDSRQRNERDQSRGQPGDGWIA